MLRQAQRLIPAAVVLFFAGMAGWLIHREAAIPRPTAPSAEAAPKAQPPDLWMGVFTGETERAGFMHLHTAPAARDGIEGTEFKVLAKLELPLFNLPTDLTINGTAWLASTADLGTFSFRMGSGEHDMQVEGKLSDGALTASLRTGDDVLPFTYPVSAKQLQAATSGLSMRTPHLKSGDTVYVDTFDPTTMMTGRAKVSYAGEEDLTVEGKPVHTTIVSTTLGSITSRAWVDADDVVVRAETPFGFTLKKISAEEALSPLAPGERANLIKEYLVRPEGKTPHRGAGYMRVRFSGVPDENLPVTDATQTRTGDVYEITRPNAPADATVENFKDGLAPDALAESLKSDAFLPADNPKIQQQVREVAGAETNPWEKAARINAWLYKTLNKVSVISVPAALDVLKTKEGDCNEHTVLFVTMARGAGIPSRIAIGLVWSDELQGFGYHAWPEVYVRGWVPMEPTLGQTVADATHIKLLNGSIEKWAQLLPYIGKLQVEILDTR